MEADTVNLQRFFGFNSPGMKTVNATTGGKKFVQAPRNNPI